MELSEERFRGIVEPRGVGLWDGGLVNRERLVVGVVEAEAPSVEHEAAGFGGLARDV